VAGKAPAADILAHSGRLYDSWVSELKATNPTGEQPLWATQTTNKNTGGTTWRCKECHGWDYKGKNGAYGKGSHLTGFTGVINGAAAQSREQLLGIMSGANDYRHDFSKLLGDPHTGHIVDFLKFGVVNLTPHIDYSTKKPIGSNVAEGKKAYDASCAVCHGADGRTLKFGSAQEVVGTIAVDNPWEFVHKVRFGQPNSAMPSGVVNGWSMQQVVDVLGYSQTLPVK
ncbi:MAG: hypothetical protein HW399_414, partial [Dehalococcoidia bacterium]|nr:hypothetical protein [Dehalococcoidia bacterium]